MSLSGIHFHDGMELDDGTLLLIGYDTDVDMAEDPHTLLLVRKPGADFEEVGHVSWLASHAHANNANDALVIVGRWGEFLDYGLDDYRKGVVEETGEVEFSSVDQIAGEVYACGTSRTVVRYDHDGEWVDASVPNGVGGSIEALAGFASDELYGFGWSGEIWLRRDTWHSVNSPTDRTLFAAGVVGDKVYAAGQLGTVICGRNEDWEVVGNAGSADIWSVREFDGVPYFSSIRGIWRLVDGVFQQTDSAALNTTICVFTGPSGLWSVGGGTLGLWNGEAWELVVQT